MGVGGSSPLCSTILVLVPLEDPWLPIAALLVGGVVGWALTALALSRRSHRRTLDTAERLASAETLAHTEKDRRLQAEAELLATEERLATVDRDLAVARERAEGAGRLFEEQRSFVEGSRKQLEDAFGSLAAAALQGSSEQFLALAEQRLDKERSAARAELDERKQAVEGLVTPLRESLERLDRRTGELEKNRAADHSRLGEQVEQLARTTANLRDETLSLTTALRGTEVGGRWGELALRRVAEIAGMTAHCDFQEQLTLADGARPDMVVHLPEGRRIAVDAKAPLNAFLDASRARKRPERREALERYSKALRGHVRQLASRDYAAALGADTDFVVLFLPADAFLGAAFRSDPDLQVDALRSKVLLATPTTLVALLRTVAIYWQQRSMADNAEAIAEVARELYARAAKFSEDLGSIGRGLTAALDAYDRAVGSFDRRLMPMGQRLDELKVSDGTRRDLDAPEIVGRKPRRIESE